MMANRPHFDISAAVVRQLGDELVSDEVTAIVELVKNAYDADADYANVVVRTKDMPSGPGARFPKAMGFITVDDNGMGMNRAEIEGGWLVISLSQKRDLKAKQQTTPRGRTPLGDKGLGRLSTQKLGHNLELITRKDGTAETLHVAFSWSSFTEDKSLGAVPVEIEPALEIRKKGTKLIVSSLRNPAVWQGQAVDNLARDLSQIISPFQQARSFLVTLDVDGRTIDLGEISAQARKAAAGTFTIDYKGGKLVVDGKIKLSKFRGNQTGTELEFFERFVTPSRGRDLFEYLKNKRPPLKMAYSNDLAYFMTIHHEVDLESLGGAERLSGKAANPGPFHSEIDDFVLRGPDAQLEIKSLGRRTTIAELVKQHAGIKVFRDGFGVRPYGINGEDWLRLGEGQTSGTSWYGLRPHNVVGFVGISEAQNSHLREKTDREGFVASPYSTNFRLLMKQATNSITNFYEWVRRGYNEYRREKLAKGARLESGRSAITDAREVSRRVASYAERARAVEDASTNVRKRVAALSDRITNQPLLVTPEERKLAKLIADAKSALEASDALAADLATYADDAKKLQGLVEVLGPRLDVLNEQLEDFSDLAGLGLLAEALSHEVHNQTDRLAQRGRSAADAARRASPPNTDLLVLAGEVTSMAAAMRRQLAHLGPSLRYQRDQLERFGIGAFFEGAREYFMERWTDKRLHFDLNLLHDFQVKTNRGRLTQVSDNLLLNSEYWLLQGGPAEADTALGTTVQIDAPFVRIADSGRGVDPSVEDSLFDPFVTLKPRKSGRGLGLFIASQILESMGCTVALLYARNTLGRRYIFELDLSGIVDGS